MPGGAGDFDESIRLMHNAIDGGQAQEEKARAVKDSDANARRRPGGKHASSSHLSEGSMEGRCSGQLNGLRSHRRWKINLREVDVEGMEIREFAAGTFSCAW